MKKRMISYDGDATAAGHECWVWECSGRELVSVAGIF